MNNTKCIFFDIDDTLVSHTAAQLAALSVLLKSMAPDLVISRKIYENTVNFWRLSSKKYMDEYVAGHLNFDEQLFFRVRELAKFLQISLKNVEIEKMAFDFRKIYEDSIRPVEGVANMLNFLFEMCMLGIISNGQLIQQKRKLLNAGLDKYFKYFVTSQDAGVGKPNREIFDYALQLCHLSRSQVLYVGDSLETDVNGALNAGWQAIHFSLDPAATSSAITATSIKELLNIIDDWIKK